MSDRVRKRDSLPILKTQRDVTRVHNPKVADKSTPYWWEAAPVRPLPPRPLAKKLDVAIVGAGYAGLSAGLVLAREGRSVAAFDAMSPGEGASSRNGGITSGTIRPDYATITKRFGEEKAMAIEAEGKIAREFLYDFIKTEGLDCDFRLVGAFKGALGYNQYETMARGAERLARCSGSNPMPFLIPSSATTSAPTSTAAVRFGWTSADCTRPSSTPNSCAWRSLRGSRYIRTRLSPRSNRMFPGSTS